jgi:hypothetical protein
MRLFYQWFQAKEKEKLFLFRPSRHLEARNIFPLALMLNTKWR